MFKKLITGSLVVALHYMITIGGSLAIIWMAVQEIKTPLFGHIPYHPFVVFGAAVLAMFLLWLLTRIYAEVVVVIFMIEKHLRKLSNSK